ncbi:MAG: cupin domain-containing protein [Thioalkalivibrio sp.]|nr:MAG: cupin domain-containing protein [Thioalkalivibrio sp.]
MTRTAQPPAEYWFEERCHITEWWNTPADAAVSVARARVEPGVTTRLHRLRGVTERYVILEGRGRAEVGAGAPREVGPGEVVVVPPGTAQRIANIGDSDLVFLAVCTPRFVRDVYEDIDPESV